jgi:hypothetical protein
MKILKLWFEVSHEHRGTVDSWLFCWTIVSVLVLVTSLFVILKHGSLRIGSRTALAVLLLLFWSTHSYVILRTIAGVWQWRD